MKVKGQIIGGEFGKIIARQKSDENLEIGELLIAGSGNTKILLQVCDLVYSSQISQQNVELISGMELEENFESRFIEPELNYYKLAVLKSLITIEGGNAKTSKALPSFFSHVREVIKDDLGFITKPDNPLFLGNLRSGSRALDVPIYLNGKDVFSHHVLIAATTGRGKSNLTSCMLWDSVGKDYCGILVLDPHDEYYGRNKTGLKDHPARQNVKYYTPNNPPPGGLSLKINIKNLKPYHFDGVFDWSVPQNEALNSYYRKYGEKWIENILLDSAMDYYNEGTIAVIRRRLMHILGIQKEDNSFIERGIFSLSAGETTIKDIVGYLEKANKVVIDTSSFSGKIEILVGSMIAGEVLDKYRYYKYQGTIGQKPVISIILEEAPRVLGKEVLERGRNVFATIAKEGRKFKVGLCAITQLPSLIPRDILANMNTKIILGIEMAPERAAIIESSAQDLSDDNRNIASLDRGEAIVTSNFARFATPIKIPLFSEFIKQYSGDKPIERSFSGINMG